MLHASNLTRVLKIRIPLFSNVQAPKKVLSGPDQNSNKSDREFKETLTSTLSSVICIHEQTLKEK